MATRPLTPGAGGFEQSVEQLPDLRPVRPTAAPIEDPASFGEAFTANRELARDDGSDFQNRVLREGYAPILEALGDHVPYGRTRYQGRDYQTFLINPADLDDDPRPAFVDRAPGGTAGFAFPVRGDMEAAIVAQIRARRAAGNPDFLKGVPDTVEGLHAYFRDGAIQRRRGNQAVAARGPGGLTGTIASLGGSLTGAMQDPVNLVTLPIGGPGKTIWQTMAREALINGAIELAEQPIVAKNREYVGEHLTLGEAAANVGTAAAGAAILTGTVHVGAKGIMATGIPQKIGAIVTAMPEKARSYWAPKIGAGKQAATEFFATLSNRDLVRFARDLHGDKMTPDETAAANVLERAHDVGETSPYEPGPAGDGAHEAGLAEAIQAVQRGILPTDHVADAGAGSSAPASARPRAELSTGPRPQTRERFEIRDDAGAIERFKARVRHAESSGNDAAANPRSSAEGRFQITDGTFRSYYKRLFGSDPGAHPAAGVKNDPATQERIMDALTADHVAKLKAIGAPITEGNLYLLHFAGEGDGPKILRANPSTPIEQIVSGDVIAANPFLRGKTARDVIAWAHTKMDAYVPAGGGRATIAADAEDPAIARLKAEALQLDDTIVGLTRRPDGSTVTAGTRSVPSSSILIDADRFQFKSGGDAFGVTERLRGVTEFDPVLSGRVILWEDPDGKLFVADGHQRVGLANRISAESGKSVPIDAIVLRAADGVSSEDARIMAALKNIAEGTGSPVDAAKVIRGAGPHLLERLPPRSALVRDGAALARLSDDAFGAVYNGVVPPDFAAVIGHLLPDHPEAHGAMIELLARTDPANRTQAESIIRQGIAAGFHVEHQEDLFGGVDVTRNLFAERAKVLEKAIAKIRRLGLVHKTAATEKDALEAVGSTIAAERSAREAQANAEAVQIVDRLAFSKGPVADALNGAAAKLAAGGKLAGVVDGLVAELRKLDLAALSREAPIDAASGRGVDGAGRGSDAGEAGAALRGEPEQPTLDELQAATERFSDPDGKAVQQQAESLVHDFKAEVEARPNVAEGRTVFRGEHGAGHNGEIQHRLASISFSEDRGVAEIYAKQPNDRVNDPSAIEPRVIQAALDIRNPVMNDPEDAFVGLDVIERTLGREKAVEAAHDFAEFIEHTSNWIDEINPDGEFANLADYIDRHPDKIGNLYFDAYVLFDDPKWVARFKAAGFDGAIHGGMGESALTTEFKVFDKSQIKRLEQAVGSGQGKNPLDLGDKVDPAAAERLRQELALKAGSPLRPDGIDPLASAEAAATFRMDEEGGEISDADLFAELEADRKAIKDIEDCL